MEKMLLTRKEVETVCSVSRATIYRGITAGKFPRPCQLPGGATRWRVADITEWIKALPECNDETSHNYRVREKNGRA